MIIKKNVALSENGFVFNPGTGESFSVNPVGALIIKLLSEKKNESQIMDEVVKVYDVDKGTFERDYEDFVGKLQDHKLVESNE